MQINYCAIKLNSNSGGARCWHGNRQVDDLEALGRCSRRCSWSASRFLLANSTRFFELIHPRIQSLVRCSFCLLDVNFATSAALLQPISILHTTRQTEPSGEPSTSCPALIKTESQWRNCSKATPSPARAHDSPPAWTSPQRLKVTH